MIPSPHERLPRQGLLLLAALSLFWGANWPIMKMVLSEVPPLYFRGACLLLGRLAESRLHGAPYPQSWEFYVIGICLFLVAAFPGFIYRYMWRKDG